MAQPETTCPAIADWWPSSREEWNYWQKLVSDEIDRQTGRVERLRFALRVIANLPVSEQDDLMAANMRKIAQDALQ